MSTHLQIGGKLRHGLGGLALLVGLVLPARAVTAQAPLEYQIKAACLYNFAKFVEWPANAFAGKNRPLVFGILGDDPFGATLDDLVAGKTIDARPLVVRRYATVADLKQDENCQVLFISAAMKSRVKRTLEDLRGLSVLTVGETDGFARDGGMIRFVTVGDRVRFEVSLPALKRANLKLSSEVLKLTILVSPDATTNN